MKTYLAIDIGGTNLRYGLVAENGLILRRGRVPARMERGPDTILTDLVERLRALTADIPADEQPVGLGLGAAGRLRPDRGLLVSSPNLPGWQNIPLAARLSGALGLEVRIGNDADLHALGEWLAGAGKGLKNLVVLTLGTGVGGGLVLDGRIWTGSFGTSGEVGHIVIEPEGRACPCGSRGCLEQYSSATAIARYAAEKFNADKNRSLYRGSPDELTCARLYDLAGQGDALALEAFARAGWALGIALTGVFNLLGLEGAILGGGASEAFDFIAPAMKAEFARRVFAVDPDQIRFARAALGDDAPLVGASALFLPNSHK